MNRMIVASAAGITAIGVGTAWLQKKPITKIVLGGYLTALGLSILDMFGGGFSQLAGGIALVALVTVFLTSADWVALVFGGLNQQPPTTGGGAHPTSH
jgi:hypothetical protein